VTSDLASEMSWQQCTMQLGSLPAEMVEELFEKHGACSVTLSDAGDHPVLEPGLGETPLWPDTQISGLFAASSDLGKLRDALLDAFQLKRLPGFRIERLADCVWEREWLRDFRPMAFGKRLWVCPGECSVDATDAVVVALDPGLACGTETHATTALCLEWLDSSELRGRTVLDYGCGSGILCIAALLLGAESAMAIDTDPQAITATRQNAQRNGVSDRLTTTMRHDAIQQRFDIVVANILAAPLIEHAAAISARLKPRGELTLSGILAAQADAVRKAYAEYLEFEPAQRREDWIRLTGRSK
jgi:ribosomal protein L11 methyltransferase